MYDPAVTGRKDIDRLRTELEVLFNDVWRAPRFAARRHFRPAVDCFRTGDPAEFVVLVELPGVDPETVNVIAADDVLLITGERRRPRAGNGGQVYQQMEIDYGPFERQVALPEDIETENGSASYEHGLLRIVFPIAPRPAASGRVPIEVRRP
jgi:HSP20 family protein